MIRITGDKPEVYTTLEVIRQYYNHPSQAHFTQGGINRESKMFLDPEVIITNLPLYLAIGVEGSLVCHNDGGMITTTPSYKVYQFYKPSVLISIGNNIVTIEDNKKGVLLKL